MSCSATEWCPHRLARALGTRLSAGIGLGLLLMACAQNDGGAAAVVVPSLDDPFSETLWQTGMEEGNLRAWSSFPGEETSFDSGRCERPADGVSEEFVHAGAYALVMRAHTPTGGESGCRQFRFPEAESPEGLYYSFWLYLPHAYEINYWTLFAQFKSRTPAGLNDPVWSLQLKNDRDGQMILALVFKCYCLGPWRDEAVWHESGYNLQTFRQNEAVIEPNRWTFIEIYRLPSEVHDGRLAVWQDGRLLWDFEAITTTYPGGSDSFSLTAYGQDVWAVDGTSRSPWFTTVFDDVAITRRAAHQVDQ